MAKRLKLGQFDGMTTEQMLIEVARANIKRYGTVTPTYEALLPVLRKTCSHCGFEGLIIKDFGVRTVRGETRPQSWCRNCRNSKDSHPTRFGR